MAAAAAWRGMAAKMAAASNKWLAYLKKT